MSIDDLLRSETTRTVFCRGIFVVFLLLGDLLAGSTSAQTVTLRLATGSKTGVYYPIGCGIKTALEEA